MCLVSNHVPIYIKVKYLLAHEIFFPNKMSKKLFGSAHDDLLYYCSKNNSIFTKLYLLMPVCSTSWKLILLFLHFGTEVTLTQFFRDCTWEWLPFVISMITCLCLLTKNHVSRHASFQRRPFIKSDLNWNRRKIKLI